MYILLISESTTQLMLLPFSLALTERIVSTVWCLPFWSWVGLSISAPYLLMIVKLLRMSPFITQYGGGESTNGEVQIAEVKDSFMGNHFTVKFTA